MDGEDGVIDEIDLMRTHSIVVLIVIGNDEFSLRSEAYSNRMSEFEGDQRLYLLLVDFCSGNDCRDISIRSNPPNGTIT